MSNIELIYILARIIIDLSFLAAIFFVLAFYSPHILNHKLGIDISYVGGLTIGIVMGGLVLIDYILVKNNIPIGFTDLMRVLGFFENNCQYEKLFSKCL